MVLVQRLMQKLRQGAAPAPREGPETVAIRPKDRREARRYAADHHALVCLEVEGSPRQEARVLDFSERGLRLRLPSSARAGTLGRAWIHFNGCVLRREFEVVRVEGDVVAARLRPAVEAAEQTMSYLHFLNWRSTQAGAA